MLSNNDQSYTKSVEALAEAVLNLDFMKAKNLYLEVSKQKLPDDYLQDHLWHSLTRGLLNTIDTIDTQYKQPGSIKLLLTQLIIDSDKIENIEKLFDLIFCYNKPRYGISVTTMLELMKYNLKVNITSYEVFYLCFIDKYFTKSAFQRRFDYKDLLFPQALCDEINKEKTTISTQNPSLKPHEVINRVVELRILHKRYKPIWQLSVIDTLIYLDFRMQALVIDETIIKDPNNTGPNYSQKLKLTLQHLEKQNFEGFSEDMAEYLKNLQKNSIVKLSAIAKEALSNQALELKVTLTSDKQLFEIPVKLGAKVYELQTLQDLKADQNGRRINPETGKGFILEQLEPAIDIAVQIEKMAAAVIEDCTTGRKMIAELIKNKESTLKAIEALRLNPITSSQSRIMGKLNMLSPTSTIIEAKSIVKASTPDNLFEKEFSEDMQEDLVKLKTRPFASLSSEEKEAINKDEKIDKTLRDPINNKLMEIPVRLNNNIYNLQTLTSLPLEKDGKRINPHSKKGFKLIQLSLEESIADELDKLAKPIIEARNKIVISAPGGGIQFPAEIDNTPAGGPGF